MPSPQNISRAPCYFPSVQAKPHIYQMTSSPDLCPGPWTLSWLGGNQISLCLLPWGSRECGLLVKPAWRLVGQARAAPCSWPGGSGTGDGQLSPCRGRWRSQKKGARLGGHAEKVGPRFSRACRKDPVSRLWVLSQKEQGHLWGRGVCGGHGGLLGCLGQCVGLDSEGKHPLCAVHPYLWCHRALGRRLGSSIFT